MRCILRSIQNIFSVISRETQNQTFHTDCATKSPTVDYPSSFFVETLPSSRSDSNVTHSHNSQLTESDGRINTQRDIWNNEKAANNGAVWIVMEESRQHKLLARVG